MKRPRRKRIADLISETERAFTLGVKIIIPFIAIMLIVVGTVVWMEYRLHRGEINDNYVYKGQILARALAASIEQEEPQVPLNDSTELAKYIQQVMDLDPAVLRANIYVQGEERVSTVTSSDPSLVGRPAEAYDTGPLYTGLTETRETQLGGERALEVLAPVRIDDDTVASLELYVSLKERDAALQALTLRLTVIPALAVILAAGIVWFSLRILVLRRLRRMVQAGERLAQGDMTSRVSGRWNRPGRDEIATAIHQFNNMAESIQSLAAMLEHLGVTDSLTGINNRRAFDEMLPGEVSRSSRLGTPVSLVMLDIDHFKRFNDRFGHPAGDETLRRVAKTLARHLRAMDSVMRYGGDEFAVILPGADPESALATAERLRSAVESTSHDFAADGEPLTVSVGVATYPHDADGAITLVTAADSAMYAAKQAGRNTVRVAKKVDVRPIAG